MAESETMSVDTSTENQDDPLMELTDEQIFQLLEDTLYVSHVKRPFSCIFCLDSHQTAMLICPPYECEYVLQ